ncbi:MAG TPA: SRPBCC family protein [Jatrophihabitans sp.]|nr:SRPBCC family protein [Jatrophihabitans sp.]
MTRSVTHDTFTLERTYPHSPERVFNAWAKSDAKAAWFGDDEQLETRGSYSLDFRIGGRERFTAVMTDGTPVRYDAVYQDIVDAERIVLSYDMHLNDQRISVSLMTVEFVGAPGGTQMVLTEQDAFLDGLDTREQREEGTRILFDKLGEFLDKS